VGPVGTEPRLSASSSTCSRAQWPLNSPASAGAIPPSFQLGEPLFAQALISHVLRAA
jgi:hypothetical protein